MLARGRCRRLMVRYQLLPPKEGTRPLRPEPPPDAPKNLPSLWLRATGERPGIAPVLGLTGLLVQPPTGLQGLPGAVSYTHLTLPTSDLV